MFPFFRALVCAFVASTFARGADFRVGAAQVEINPAPGTPLAGYYSLRPSDGVLDDLQAKALVFEAGGERAAVVIADLISLPRHVVVKARELVAQQSGIPADRVMFAATHTHTAPVIARETSRDDFDGASSDLGRAYTEQLPALLAKSVVEAQAALRPARMRAAKGRVEELAFNRRFRMKDGSVAWNPRKLDPAIVEPAGPIDPEVGVLAFDQIVTADKSAFEPLATFVNYAMHPDTVGGVRISADYPGALARALAPVRTGVVVFGNGCCGNLNHRNISWVDPQKGPSETERLARILAGAVCASLPRLADTAVETLRVRREIVRLPLPEISEAERTQARETVRRIRDAKFLEQVKAFQVLDVLARNGEPWEVEVQVIALGNDVAFVSLPGEIFVELGLEIKKRSPFAHTFLIELANGAIGYIPNRPAYTEGAYEVMSARCAAGSGEQLVETAVKLLRECTSALAQNSEPPPFNGQGRPNRDRPGPWDNDVLVYRVSEGGPAEKLATFARAGVSTVARLKDGRLIAAHQHFPADNDADFDKVAVHFSADEGRTWTSPEVVRLQGLPEGMRFPFDPTLVPLPDGRVRLYFTSLKGRRLEEDRPAIYSAISEDGLNFVFEPGVRFGVNNRPVIDCAVALHAGVFHLFAPDNGAGFNPGEVRREPGDRPREGVAYHATSPDGLEFTRRNDVQVEGRRRWLGAAVSDGEMLRFFGTGGPGGVWMAASSDGQSWTMDDKLPRIMGADPGAVRLRDGAWLLTVTGPPRARR